MSLVGLQNEQLRYAMQGCPLPNGGTYGCNNGYNAGADLAGSIFNFIGLGLNFATAFVPKGQNVNTAATTTSGAGGGNARDLKTQLDSLNKDQQSLIQQKKDNQTSISQWEAQITEEQKAALNNLDAAQKDLTSKTEAYTQACTNLDNTTQALETANTNLSNIEKQLKALKEDDPKYNETKAKLEADKKTAEDAKKTAEEAKKAAEDAKKAAEEAKKAAEDALKQANQNVTDTARLANEQIKALNEANQDIDKKLADIEKQILQVTQELDKIDGKKGVEDQLNMADNVYDVLFDENGNIVSVTGNDGKDMNNYPQAFKTASTRLIQAFQSGNMADVEKYATHIDKLYDKLPADLQKNNMYKSYHETAEEHLARIKKETPAA